MGIQNARNIVNKSVRMVRIRLIETFISHHLINHYKCIRFATFQIIYLDKACFQTKKTGIVQAQGRVLNMRQHDKDCTFVHNSAAEKVTIVHNDLQSAK